MERYRTVMQTERGCAICLDSMSNTRKYPAFGNGEYREKALDEGLFIRVCPICYNKIMRNEDGWADKIRANAVSLINERKRLGRSNVTPKDFGETNPVLLKGEK